MVPIFGIAGQAGSGKDTLANYLAKRYNGVCVAQADPMKRIVQGIFGFSNTQLWGPSEQRNAIDSGFFLVSDRICYGETHHSLDDIEGFLHHHNTQTNLVAIFGEENARKASSLIASAVFPVCRDFIRQNNGLTPRIVLQTSGTEVGRAVDRDVWARFNRQSHFDLLCGGYSYEPSIGLFQTTNRGFGVGYTPDIRFRNEILGLRREGGIVIKIVRSDPSAAAKTAAAGVSGHQSEAELGGIPDHFYDHILHNDGTLEDLYRKGDDLMLRYGIKPVDNS
jgi:hypothetical protein